MIVLNSKQARFSVSALAVAIALCAPAAAYAKDAATDKTAVADTDADQEQRRRENDIVVSGQNIAQEGAFAGRTAVSVKEDAQGIVDSIGPELLGLTPDLDLVESAVRVVGVSGEINIPVSNIGTKANGLAIRGFSSNNNLATIDGVPIATVNQSTRGDPSLIFPTSLVQRIDVLKTFSADRDPHGLGGQVDYITKSAFDYNKRGFLYVQGGIGLNSKSGSELWARQPSYRASIVGGQRFGSDDQFGLVFDAEYQRVISATSSETSSPIYYQKNGTSTTQYVSLSGFGDNLGNSSITDYGADYRTEKAGASLKLEYRGDKLSLNAMGGYYDYSSYINSAYTAIYSRGKATNITATEADFTQGQVNQSDLNLPTHYTNKLFTANGTYDFSDALSLRVVGSYSAATSDANQIISNWSLNIPAAADGSSQLVYKLNDGVYRAYFADSQYAILNNPASYSQVNSYIMPQDQFLTDTDVVFGRAELSWNGGPKDQGLGLRIGGTYTRTTIGYDVQYQKYTVLPANVSKTLGAIPGLQYPGSVPSTTAPGVLQFRTDPQKTATYLYQNLSWFGQQSDWASQNEANDWHESEEIKAFYAQAQYQTHKLALIAGLRYDSTDIDVNTMMARPAGSTSPFAYVPAPTRNGHYDYWLPSALVTYYVGSDMRVRAAFSKTIGRPNYSNLTGLTTYTIGVDTETGEDTLRVSKGNENLKPLETLNYDLSFEWFSPTWGMIALATFYKNERNVIVSGSERFDTYEYQGVTYRDVTVTQPLNARKGYDVGVEVSYSKDNFHLPGILDGIGMMANFTWLKGSYELPMSAAAVADGGDPELRDTPAQPNQPSYICNVALTYRKNKWGGMVSFQRTGKFLYSASSSSSPFDIFYMPRNQLDASVRYDVTKWASLSFQAQNITHPMQDSREGPGAAYRYRNATTGANYWLMLQLKF